MPAQSQRIKAIKLFPSPERDGIDADDEVDKFRSGCFGWKQVVKREADRSLRINVKHYESGPRQAGKTHRGKSGRRQPGQSDGLNDSSKRCHKRVAAALVDYIQAANSPAAFSWATA
jgi:hypothetical protein